MAASVQLGISFKQILLLSLLLLLLVPSSSPLRSVTAADTSSPETLNNDGSMEKMFSICKLTGHFRVHFFGVVIECPEVDAPKLEPISGGTDPSRPSIRAEFDGGVHQPPVSSALARNRPMEKGEACHGTKADAAGISDEL